MMNLDEKDGAIEPEKVEIAYQALDVLLRPDITLLIPIIHSCFEKIAAVQRKVYIAKILAAKDWHEHYRDKATGRKVLSETEFIEHQHELITAICLAQINFDVIFAPKAMFTITTRNLTSS